MDYIVYAIPVFFILIGIELLIGFISGRKLYRFHDTVNDLSMGIISTVGGVFLATLTFAGYLFVWDQFRLVDMGATHLWDYSAPLWVWVAAFLCKDFMYYWAHRMSHEMNVGWATHIAHHQSEEYNLSVALRQGVFQGLFFWVFYIPMAFVGFPPVVYLVVTQFNTLYQFWIHTRAIGKLGPLEWVLNTPSHHRVHHGRDEKYIDKNHGGTLIIWDRMFGTFQEEEEEPNYGIVTPLKSWNPLWGQVHYFVKLWRTAKAAPRWQDKLLLWVKEPAWQPEGLPPPPPPETARPDYEKYDTRVPAGLNVYVFAHFTLILVLSTGFLQTAEALSVWEKALGAGIVFVTVGALGALFEGRRWAMYVELGRVLLLTAILVAWGGQLFGVMIPAHPAAQAAILAAGGVSLYWFTRYRKLFGPQGLLPMPEESAEKETAGA